MAGAGQPQKPTYNATVKRILLKDGRATGVELIDGRELSCNCEIILSAGALVSPKLLMLSGIGDPGDIAPHNINMMHTLLGVGKNLQDHAAVWATMKTVSRTPWGFSWPKLPYFAVEAIKYIFTQKGWFSAQLIESGGFVKSDPALERPDIQFVFMPGQRVPPPKIIDYGHGYSAVAVLLRPKSRGSTSHRSKVLLRRTRSRQTALGLEGMPPDHSW